MLREKWRLDALLGVGGMAAVYAATHRNANRVAVKMLHGHLSMDPSVRDRFLREGYLANSIEHDGAVKVLDDDVAEDGSVFLVMELLQGETLDARWERLGGSFPVGEVVAIADQILDVLGSAHTRGIVHRDIKPENIFLTATGAVKVLDFGIARLLERAGSASGTKTGSMLGTPAFMPPEQALGHVQEVDARSDIWAVGAVMFSLLSGELVHAGRTANEQLIAAATRPARPLRSVAPSVPEALCRVVDTALAFDRAMRWPTASAMRSAMRDATASAVVATPAMAHTDTGTVVAGPPVLSMPARGSMPSYGQVASTGTVVATVAATGPGRTVSWDKPPTVTTGASLATGRTLAQPSTRKAYIAIGAGGAAALVAGLVIVLVLAFARGHGSESDEAANVVPLGSAQPVASSPATPVVVASGTPPVAEPSATVAPTGPTGTLDVVAVNGPCDAAIDGKLLGATPLEGTVVVEGEHEVVCVFPGGKSQKKNVSVGAGSRQKISFTRPRAGGGRPVDPLDVR